MRCRLYWDIEGEIGLKVKQIPLRGGSAIEREYACTARQRTYVWPGAEVIAETLGGCMEELMAKIGRDEAWNR